MHKLKILYYSIVGYCYKLLIDFNLLSIPQLKGEGTLIVSLTSYGRRVSSCVVYYTLVSLLRQSVQPYKIVLWLAENEWNSTTLPLKLNALIKNGVEIKYCKDIRSYKKLIPTIENYPGYDIMTVDDDVYYDKHTIKNALLEQKIHPNAIICQNAVIPVIKDGVPTNYLEWKESYSNILGKLIFPIGVGGVLYPKNSLHPDVLREDLFQNLCPLADDIWFWFCGLLNGTEKIYIKKKHQDYSYDAIYQYFHNGSALSHVNRTEHANDKQVRDLFKFYSVALSDDGNLYSLK